MNKVNKANEGLRLDLGVRRLLPEWKRMLARKNLRDDVVAGLTVACVAVPLSLAIALASGVTPGASNIWTGLASGRGDSPPQPAPKPNARSARPSKRNARINPKILLKSTQIGFQPLVITVLADWTSEFFPGALAH